MAEKRIGQQEPTVSYILHYEKTLGEEALELYKKTGREAREWQKAICYDIMAIGDDGLWTHSIFGYSVPRRNGKTESVIMRMIWGLMNGEKILYTAHKVNTAHSVWETVVYLLEAMEIECKTIKAMGMENIRLRDENGKPYQLDHCINFRTRTASGGLGEGYDLLIIDEAQEYTIDQETALKYIVGASPNPQTILLGTPPTLTSRGTVFKNLRTKILSGESRYAGWEEWSIDQLHDVHDVDAWYMCNPSLGIGLSERIIENEITGDDVDFNVQRLGHWLNYRQASAISLGDWEKLKLTYMPNFKDKLYVGIKYAKDGSNVSVAIATRIDDKRYVEAIDCRPIREGNQWIAGFLMKADVAMIAIDGAGAGQLLKRDLEDFGVTQEIRLPTVKEIILANSQFEESVFSKKDIAHNNQPSVRNVVSNCEKRAIGTNGGFGYRSMRDDMDITLLDSIILANWLCIENRKPVAKQRIGY